MGKSCKFCQKHGPEEQMIRCASCRGYCHPSCLELPAHIVPTVRTYDWQCNDCKYCYQCQDIENEEQILFCDKCDRGYHMYCVDPPLKKKPKGNWFCPICLENERKEKEKCEKKKMEGETKRTSSPEKETEENEEPPQKIPNTSSQESTDALLKERKSVLLTNQTPIEHTVSRTDLELFSAAKQKAQEIQEIEQESAPSQDGLKVAVLGDVQIEAWYKSQYPLEYNKLSRIYICEFCLQYLKDETIYKRHIVKCEMRYPPGNEIYRKDQLSVFEVDGQSATPYCQNLCLFAKMFLDHKTLLVDVAPFLFYVMTVTDQKGSHIIGYFSKEKVSFLNYNVSCILIFPHHMRKGYGKMLIEFSYLLSKIEGKVGSPEKPLSDLGLVSYRKYWQDCLLNYLLSYEDDQISIKVISEKMALHPNDIISTLQFLGMLKYWKGKHLILLKKEIIEEYGKKVKDRSEGYRKIDPSCLRWTPKVYQ